MSDNDETTTSRHNEALDEKIVAPTCNPQYVGIPYNAGWDATQLRELNTQSYPQNINIETPSMVRYYITDLAQYPRFLTTSWHWLDCSIATGHRYFTPTDILYRQWVEQTYTHKQYQQHYIDQLRASYQDHKQQWQMFLRLPTLIFCVRTDEHWVHAQILADLFVAFQHRQHREAIVITQDPSQSP